LRLGLVFGQAHPGDLRLTGGTGVVGVWPYAS
jgi:hypothetical protein